MTKRKDGRYQKMIELGYELGPDGLPRRLRKYVYGKTPRELNANVFQARLELQQGIRPDMDRLTVGAYLNSWLQTSKRPRLAPTTYAKYESTLRVHLIPALGLTLLKSLRAEDVERLRNQKLRAGKHPTTVADMLNLLSSALSQAVHRGLVVRNVAQPSMVQRPRQPRREMHTFTVEEARLFLEAIEADKLRALFVTALALGLRSSELLGLKWEDIDLREGRLTVRAALHNVGGKLQRTDPKNDSSATVLKLPAVALSALKEQKRQQLEERLLGGARWQDTGYVFTSRWGTPLWRGNVRRAFLRILRKSGLPQLRFHEMRHTIATLLLESGEDLKSVSKVLRHRDVRTTANIYVHVTERMRQATADRTDRLFGHPQAQAVPDEMGEGDAS